MPPKKEHTAALRSLSRLWVRARFLNGEGDRTKGHRGGMRAHRVHGKKKKSGPDGLWGKAGIHETRYLFFSHHRRTTLFLMLAETMAGW